MKPRTRQGDSARRTLNEVLATELSSLRPVLKDKVEAASYARKPEEREENLRQIYRTIGALSDRQRSPTLRKEPLSALCLSGGGIRSATFNLGVLQILAKIGLLGKFDYLSSVSGGGYIASWLRAWMHRRGVPEVVKDLGRGAKGCDPLKTEPRAVANLREYSNYLTPAVGLFSGDTWSAAATIARNLILNWLVLVPLLAAVIGFPMLFVLVIRTTGPSGIPHAVFVDLLYAAVITEIVASGLVYYVRRFVKKPQTPQALFILLCVVPICLAGGELATAATGLNLPWATRTANTAELLQLWGFAGLWSVVVPLLGWAAAELAFRFRPHARNGEARQVSRVIEFIALVVSGAVGASLMVMIVTWWFPYLYNHPALYAVLVLPLMLGAYLLTRVIFIGIASVNDEQGDAETDGSSDGAATRSRISSNDSDREWWSRLSGWLLLIMTSWVVVTTICLAGCYTQNVLWWLGFRNQSGLEAAQIIFKWITGGLGMLSGAIAALTSSSGDTPAPGEAEGKPVKTSKKLLLAVTGPFFVICLIMALSWAVRAIAAIIIPHPEVGQFRFSQPGPEQAVPWIATLEFAGLLVGLVVLSVLASRFVNVNRFSLHGMYRNRLVRAYLGASNCTTDGRDRRTPDPFTGFALNDNLALHELCSPPETSQPKARAPKTSRQPFPQYTVERPLSIVNATLNLVNGEKLAWQQRKAESFSMTPLFCGSWLEGYRLSTQYGGPGGITVGTAVTISGAAANPNMGYSSSPVLGFLMAMFNVRLGAWLGNTNDHGDGTFNHPGPRNAIMPLFAEMFGLTNSRRRYVNLSDGGHFDNLGLYEVVLRRCRHVLVCDAGQDYSFSFEDLGNSIRKIRIDFGINIEFDRIQILPNTPETEGLCCAIGRILYSEVDDTSPDDDGLIVYIKPTLRGKGAQMPYDIYSYARGSSQFPHESTADQWFTESQFESYRVLGAHIVEQLVSDPKCAQDADFDCFYSSVGTYISKHGEDVRKTWKFHAPQAQGVPNASAQEA